MAIMLKTKETDETTAILGTWNQPCGSGRTLRTSLSPPTPQVGGLWKPGPSVTAGMASNPEIASTCSKWLHHHAASSAAARSSVSPTHSALGRDALQGSGSSPWGVGRIRSVGPDEKRDTCLKLQTTATLRPCPATRPGGRRALRGARTCPPHLHLLSAPSQSARRR